MKVILVCLLFVLGAVSAVNFDDWQDKHGKNYTSEEEYFKRRELFEKRHKLITAHNADPSKKFKLAHNQFSDKTEEEMLSLHMGIDMNNNNRVMMDTKYDARLNRQAALPSIDWTAKGAVNPIKYQGSCGCCWAFSAVAALESQWFIQTGKLQSFSEQQLIDCSVAYGNNGCNGGMPYMAYQYYNGTGNLAQNEATYPFLDVKGAVTENCLYNSANGIALVNGYVKIQAGNESALQVAVSNIGPISVAINAALPSFHSYSSGIYDDAGCNSTTITHGVTVVGYGTQNGTDYWLIRNQWNTTWGIAGYMMMARNANDMCGVATHGVYPLIGNANFAG